MENKTNSVSYYNEIDLSAEAEKSFRYLEAIDKLIISHVDYRPHGYLDLGCGDGSRGQRLIAALKPFSSVFIDSSPEMIRKAALLGEAECLNQSIAALRCKNKYDLITCLWNVLGHIENKETRLKSLKKIRDSLTPKGLFFIDFNNRYNISHYGVFSVLRNLIKDLFTREGSGWFPLNSSSSVYIHNFIEARTLLQQAGFIIKKSYNINYKTGHQSSYPCTGQTFFVVTKK